MPTFSNFAIEADNVRAASKASKLPKYFLIHDFIIKYNLNFSETKITVQLFTLNQALHTCE